MAVGSVLLGLGAWLNRGCLFGTVAQIGSRNWAYLLTPPGFLAGSYAAHRLGASPAVGDPAGRGLSLAVVALFAVLLGAAAVGRRLRPAADETARSNRRFAATTLAIGPIYVGLAAVTGKWSWSDAWITAAGGGLRAGEFDLALVAALFAGAILGGLSSPGVGWSGKRAAACFGGGALMGLGATLVPGGNDALVLNGLPGLYAYAWIAVAVMTTMIAVALLIERRLRS